MSDFVDISGVLKNLGDDRLQKGTGSSSSFRNVNAYLADQKQQAELDKIAERAALANFAAPGLVQQSPELAATLNPDMSEADIVALLSGTEQTLQISEYQSNLLDQMSVARSSQERWDIWQQVPTELQMVLKAQDGFVPPEPPPEAGIFGTGLLRAIDILPFVDTGTGDIAKGSWLAEKSQVLTNVTAPVKWTGTKAMEAFDVLDYPVKEAQRAMRTMKHFGLDIGINSAAQIAQTLGDSGSEFYTGRSDEFNQAVEDSSAWGVIKALGTELKQSWAASAEPDMTFGRGALDTTRAELGGDSFKVEVAKLMASGKDLMSVTEEITGKVQGTPEFAETFAAVYDLAYDESFTKSVAALSKSRISAGGNFVEDSTGGVIDAQSRAGVLLGAGVELSMYFLLDPTLVLAKANHVRKLAQFGVDTGRMSTELNRLHELAKLGRDGANITPEALAAAELAGASSMRSGRFARFVLSDAKRVESGARVDRAFSKIAQAYDAGDDTYQIADLLQEMPKVASLIPALNRVDAATGIRSADDVWEAVKTNQAARTMLNSAGAGRDPRIFQLPHVSKQGQRWMKTKAGWNELIRWGDGNAAAYEEAVTELSRELRSGVKNIEKYQEARKLADAARWDGISTLGRMRAQTVDSFKQTLHALTTHVPREKSLLSVAADGETAADLSANAKALEDFGRMTGFARKLGLPQEVVNDYMTLFARGNSGDRHLLVRTFTGELLSESGGMSNPRMRELYERYVDLGNKLYSGGDEIPQAWNVTDLVESSAIWTSQTSKQIAIPSWDEISKAMWRDNTVRSIAGGPVDMLDTFMNRVWKPAVLMRLGFITRAAGEETISFMMRLGPTTLAKSYLAKTATGLRRNALTGELSENLGAIENTVNGLAYKMATWSKVNNEQIMRNSLDLLPKADQRELTRLRSLMEDRNRAGDVDKAIEYQDRMFEIEEAARNKYIAEKQKRKWSNQVMNFHEWAQSRAVEMSPGYMDFVRNTKIGGKIPTKAEIARRALGVDPSMDVHRLGRITLGSNAHSWESFSNGERLIAAHYAMMTNPTTARLMAQDVAATIGPAYQAKRDVVGIEKTLAQKTWTETAMIGDRMVTMQMKNMGGDWQHLNFDDEHYFKAFGDNLLRMFADPSMNQSGVAEMVNRYIGANTMRDLTRALGPDGYSDLQDVRRYLGNAMWDDGVQSLRELVAGDAELDVDEVIAAIRRNNKVAKSDERLAEIITEVANMPRLRDKLFPHPDTLGELRTGDIDKLRDDAYNVLDQWTRRPDYQIPQADLSAASGLLGMPVVQPVPAGMVPLYGALLDSRLASRFEQAVLENPELLDDVMSTMLTKLQAANYPQADLEELAKSISATLSVKHVPTEGSINLFNLGFTDPKHADIVANGMAEFVQRAGVADQIAAARMASHNVAGSVVSDDFDLLFADAAGTTSVGKVVIEGSTIGDNRFGTFPIRKESTSTFTTFDELHKFEVLDPNERSVYIELSDGRWVDQSEFFAGRYMADGPVERAEGLDWYNKTKGSTIEVEPAVLAPKPDDSPELLRLRGDLAELEALKPVGAVGRPPVAPTRSQRPAAPERPRTAAEDALRGPGEVSSRKPDLDPEYVKELEAYEAKRAEYDRIIERDDARVTYLKQNRPGSGSAEASDPIVEAQRELELAIEDAKKRAIGPDGNLVVDEFSRGRLVAEMERIGAGDNWLADLDLRQYLLNGTIADGQVMTAMTKLEKLGGKPVQISDANLRYTMERIRQDLEELKALSPEALAKRPKGLLERTQAEYDEALAKYNDAVESARAEVLATAPVPGGTSGDLKAWEEEYDRLMLSLHETRNERRAVEKPKRRVVPRETSAAPVVENTEDFAKWEKAQAEWQEAQSEAAARLAEWEADVRLKQAQIRAAEAKAEVVKPAVTKDVPGRPIEKGTTTPASFEGEFATTLVPDIEVRIADLDRQILTARRNNKPYENAKDLVEESKADVAQLRARKARGEDVDDELTDALEYLGDAEEALSKRSPSNVDELVSERDGLRERIANLTSAEGYVTPTGKTEWINGATNEMALRALNNRRVDELFKIISANGSVTGAADEILSEALGPLVNGVFDANYHTRLAPTVELNPTWGPVMMPKLQGKADMANRLVQGWFSGVVDPAMSRIIRTPHFAVNMASAMPFAEDLYRFQVTGELDQIVMLKHKVDDDVIDSIHALWGQDELDLLDQGDDIAEAIVAMRNNELWRKPRLQEALGITVADAKDGRELARWGHMRHEAYASSIESAAIRATDLTVEFIDDHRFRSQFQQTIRQIIPFWFAEEQYMKRQYRMFAQTPEAIRKASLFLDGFRHAGFVTTDGEGNEIFAYPMTESVNRFILEHTGDVFGFDGMGAFAQPMSTNIDFMFPGMSAGRLSNPLQALMPGEANVSPLAGIPLTLMADRFPEIGSVESALLRNRAGQSPLTQIMPSSVARVMAAAGVGSYGKERMASAQMRAMQALDIAGLDPGPTATTAERQAYTDRVRNWARMLNVMDATLYATAPLPSGAGVEFVDAKLQTEFRQVMYESGMDRSEAFAAFIAKHPDYGVWQVYGSDNVTGAGIPQTKAGLDFLLDNERLLKDLPHAAAWLSPPYSESADDDWSRRAYDQMYASELRRKFAPEEYLEEIYIREALPPYYAKLEEFEQEIFMLSQRGDEQGADDLQMSLDEWKQAYLRSNPVFAASLDDNLERRNERKSQRDALLAMPRSALPPGGYVDQTLNLMTSFAQFEREISAMSGQNSNAANDRRKALRTSFYAWAQEFVKENPGARNYWTSVIQHDRIIGGYATEYTYEYGS